jgi:hypothetical protein
MAELQIHVPYTAWGEGDEWETGYLELTRDFHKAVEEGGLGSDGDPDHLDEFICFYLIGQNVRDLASAAREVLVRHNLRGSATGFLTNPDAEDGQIGTPVAL